MFAIDDTEVECRRTKDFDELRRGDFKKGSQNKFLQRESMAQ